MSDNHAPTHACELCQRPYAVTAMILRRADRDRGICPTCFGWVVRVRALEERIERLEREARVRTIGRVA